MGSTIKYEKALFQENIIVACTGLKRNHTPLIKREDISCLTQPTALRYTYI